MDQQQQPRRISSGSSGDDEETTSALRELIRGYSIERRERIKRRLFEDEEDTEEIKKRRELRERSPNGCRIMGEGPSSLRCTETTEMQVRDSEQGNETGSGGYVSDVSSTMGSSIFKIKGYVARRNFDLSWRDVLQLISEQIASLRPKLIHDVIKLTGTQNLDHVLRKILSKGSNCTILSVSYHEEGPSPHVHVLHDCKWSNHQCKCFGLVVQPRQGNVHSTESRDCKLLISSILNYFQKDPRRNCYLQIGRKYWRFYDRIENIQMSGYQGGTIHGTLQECIDQYEICAEPNTHVLPEISGNHTDVGRGITQRRSTGKTVPSTLAIAMLKVCTIPIDNITSTDFWRQSEYAYIMPSDKIYQRAVQHVKGITQSYTFKDFLKLYADINPIFCAVNCSREEYYFTPDESAKYAIELLEHQFEEEASVEGELIEDIVKSFLQNLYDVLEKKSQKKNTLAIISPPTAGKNWFFDAITHFYLNIGHIGNFNKFCNFPFQDAIERRVNIWNEPNFVESSIDTIKMLLGGDNQAVKIKFQGDRMLYKTPLIILSNNNPFRNNKAFADRMFIYKWRSAYYTVKYDKKLNPLMWPRLLEEYNIKLD